MSEDYELLIESFENLFLRDTVKREQWKGEAFRLVQTAYASIGGIKGSGFRSPDDMVRTLPFWKLYISHGKIIAAVFYKDTDGRKMVALATDGSIKGKKKLREILNAEFKMKRSYMEVSGKPLSVIQKTLPDGVELKDIVLSRQQILKLFPDKNVKFGVESEDTARFPELKQYFYERDIGSDRKVKIAFGVLKSFNR